MNPNFHPDNNPFAALMARASGGAPSPQAGVPAGPQQPQGQPDPHDVTQEGSNPGGSPFLIKAMQSMNQFISSATDPIDIAAVRGIVQVLTRLIQRDQQQQSQKMSGQPDQTAQPAEESSPSAGAVMGATRQAAQNSYSGPAGSYGA